MIVETRKIKTGFHGFDQTHGGFCSSELSVITIQQPDPNLNVVTMKQLEDGGNYVLRLLTQTLHQGLNVCYIPLNPVSKTRRVSYTNFARLNKCSLRISEVTGKTKLHRSLSGLKKLADMDAIGKTNLIIFDGVESIIQRDVQQIEKEDVAYYLALPKFLRALSVLCQCPVVVVHYESRSKEKQKRGIERLWLEQADLLLSLKRRTFLNPFIVHEDQLKGIELRVGKTSSGEGQNISWLV
jgi:hypothetical protein